MVKRKSKAAACYFLSACYYLHLSHSVSSHKCPSTQMKMKCSEITTVMEKHRRKNKDASWPVFPVTFTVASAAAVLVFHS